MRFAMTARTVSRLREQGKRINDMTKRNIEKVTRYKAGGEASLEEMVSKIRGLEVGERNDVPFDGEGEAGPREGRMKRERRWGGYI